jgi:ethanolamine ammonia-lyase small subunit
MTDDFDLKKGKSSFVTEDPAASLRKFTDARIGLGRAGVSLPLKDWLSFKLDHAKARDAVYAPFDTEEIASLLKSEGYPLVFVHSRARDKKEYLVRPDLGRRLSPESRAHLESLRDKNGWVGQDVLVTIADGLSAIAVGSHAAETAIRFLRILEDSGLNRLEGQNGEDSNLKYPVVLITGGRVAVSDEIAEILKAKIVVTLIGERPGLTAPDSMSAYVTYGAYAGIMEESRNCVSNIRPKGMPIGDAVTKISYIVQKALALKLTGTELKDDMPENYLPFEKGALLVE